MGVQSNRRTWYACLVLGLATLAVYWPVNHYAFIDYDDDGYVFNNPVVRGGLSWWGLVWSFVDQHESNWHPLTWLSHMLDCQLFGLHAGAHHLVNVIFHCANAVLLLLLLNAMTGKLGRSVFVAALFALHPLRVESVAWIAERKDVLSGLFFMLTLWWYVLHVKNQISRPVAGDISPMPTKGSPANRRSIFYKLSLACFVLGLLAKPMLVTVPFVLLLIDFWPLQRIKDFQLNAANPGTPVKKTAIFSPQLSKVLLEKLPFFLFSIIVGIITLFAQRAGGGWVSADSPLGPRLAGVVVGYWEYVEKLLWPQNLSFLYLRSNHVSTGEFFLASGVLSGISILAFVNLRRQPWLAVGWLWFVIMLLPVSGLLQLARLSIADRYTYLPAIGFYVMAVWGIMELLGALVSQKARRSLATVGALIILLACVVLTRQQLGYWQNTGTLMGHALTINPSNDVARVDLNIYLFEKAHPGVRESHPSSRSSVPAK
ncbi:MAG: hypothetical protein PHY43_15810 [Verrucomicrobiales bacterium]|nr:hypothetical protein [Verrucomicrobiales bacterium]